MSFQGNDYIVEKVLLSETTIETFFFYGIFDTTHDNIFRLTILYI